MSKRPELNPDRVKWDNDNKKKKLTKKHKLQKLAHEKSILEQEARWVKRANESYYRQLLKVNQLEIEIEQMV
jgi:hypothetical protein